MFLNNYMPTVHVLKAYGETCAFKCVLNLITSPESQESLVDNKNKKRAKSWQRKGTVMQRGSERGGS